jgi:copper chaperone CopZ
MLAGHEASWRDVMKKLFAFALAAGLSGPALAAEKTETLKVSGWHCAGCSAKTEAALKEMKGVTAVAADKSKQQVKVTYDDAKVKHADLEKAIADSGFTVDK